MDRIRNDVSATRCGTVYTIDRRVAQAELLYPDAGGGSEEGSAVYLLSAISSPLPIQLVYHRRVLPSSCLAC